MAGEPLRFVMLGKIVQRRGAHRFAFRNGPVSQVFDRVRQCRGIFRRAGEARPGVTNDPCRFPVNRRDYWTSGTKVGLQLAGYSLGHVGVVYQR